MKTNCRVCGELMVKQTFNHKYCGDCSDVVKKLAQRKLTASQAASTGLRTKFISMNEYVLQAQRSAERNK